MPFHTRLRAARERRRLTQRQLAKALGVSGAAVSYWENGEDTPEAHRFPAISNVLQVPYDQLLDPGYDDRASLIAAVREVPEDRIKTAERLLKTLKD